MADLSRAARLVLLATPCLLAGCAGAGYYAQSIRGQLAILAHQRSIEKVIADPHADEKLRRKLARIAEMRSFAVTELDLPDNGSYRSYVALERPYAVWNVVAAPELSVAPLTWCFPVAGCVSYRGYFRRERAEAFAAQLAAEGYDTVVEGVAAYSTLGWFRDPVLSTFVDWPETRLAGLLFHELAHQRVYAKDDTTFNESYATVVELAGLRRFLAGESHAAELAADRVRRGRQSSFEELVLSYRGRLADLYASDVSEADKRRRKAETFEELRRAYADLRAGWGGWGGYDDWFAQDLNNANLASIGAYGELVQPLEKLLESLGGDFHAFHREVARLAELPRDERRRQLGVPES